MNLIHCLNYLTIVIIGFACFGLTYFCSGAKYSMFKALIRGIFFKDKWYLHWFIHNSIYVWCNFLIILLVCTNLSLITQFSKDNIFQKPLFIFAVSPALWAVIVIVGFMALRDYTSKHRNFNK